MIITLETLNPSPSTYNKLKNEQNFRRKYINSAKKYYTLIDNKLLEEYYIKVKGLESKVNIILPIQTKEDCFEYLKKSEQEIINLNESVDISKLIKQNKKNHIYYKY